MVGILTSIGLIPVSSKTVKRETGYFPNSVGNNVKVTRLSI